jgi:hypothetical protein
MSVAENTVAQLLAAGSWQVDPVHLRSSERRWRTADELAAAETWRAVCSRAR